MAQAEELAQPVSILALFVLKFSDMISVELQQSICVTACSQQSILCGILIDGTLLLACQQNFDGGGRPLSCIL